HHVGGDAALPEPLRNQRGVACCDAQSIERSRLCIAPCLGDRKRESTCAKSEPAPFAERGGLSGAISARAFEQYVSPHDAEVTRAFGEQAGDVVVADEEQIDRY